MALPQRHRPKSHHYFTGVQSEQVENFTIVIQLQEDGEYLALFAPQLLNLKNHVYKGVAFQTSLPVEPSSQNIR
ncbi:protein of unknown function [Limnospira indica PCC 8005]|uniref:Uncharacterized protein n=1 Tax=Limnospira indica PCC 8005 TaxID=376219 RepID=A0A9P1NXJ5_9CYAN|nr:protein of unknown function [Limnospira indica PCC 8005]